VREATAEIEHNFAQLAELRVEQVTEKERKRIAADLHDDLGAKLLTIVHTSEASASRRSAREALEEMRLSVRGLTGKPMRLADALADWRAETVLRLGQANIEADWRARPKRPSSCCRRELRADHAHPARGGQQHHQAQRRIALQGALRDQRPPVRADRCRTTARASRWSSTASSTAATDGEHETPGQADAGPVPDGVRPRGMAP
jgi:hypothetical protein